MKIKEVRAEIMKSAGESRMVSHVLRLLRKCNDMTIVEMSEKIGLSTARISILESSTIKVEQKDVTAYAKGLNIPEESILFFVNEGNSETVIGRAKLTIQLAIIRYMMKSEELES